MTAAALPSASREHTPVLLAELLEALAPRDGALYVDGTLGAGGYARALLEAADCAVFGIDRDPAALLLATQLVRRFAGRLTVAQGRFGDMPALLAAHGIGGADGVALDLGVSSMQLDRAERGFSFQADGPLDMRMESAGASAADLVNELGEPELADLIFRFGEERKARRIAQAIVRARAAKPITRTLELAEIVRRAARPAGRQASTIDAATRTFQALRIKVNDEFDELDRGLAAAERVLRPGGRLAIVCFHSLEDRRVKDFLRQRTGGDPRPSRHMPAVPGAARPPSFRLLARRAIRPSPAETAANPRSRSARLRTAERTAAAPWGAEPARIGAAP